MPEEAVAFASRERGRAARLIGGTAGARLAGLGVAMPYNLGSWQRELDIPLAAYRRWNEFDLGRCAGRGHRARGVLRERRHGRGRGRAVPGPGPLARRLSLRVHRRCPRRRGGPGRRLPPRRQRQCRRSRADADRRRRGWRTAPRPNGRPEIALTRASVNALIRHLRARGQPVDEPRASWMRLLEAGHPAVGEWLDDAADALVVPILSAVRVLDVPAVVHRRHPAAGGARPADRAARAAALAPGLARVARPAAPGARHGRPRRAGDRCRDPAAALELQLQPRLLPA